MSTNNTRKVRKIYNAVEQFAKAAEQKQRRHPYLDLNGIPEFKFSNKEAATYRLQIVGYETVSNPAVPAGGIAGFRTYEVHRGIGPHRASFVCIGSKTCPICAKVRDIWNMEIAGPEAEAREIKKNMANAIKAKDRMLLVVVDQADPRNEDGSVKYQILDESAAEGKTSTTFGRQLNDLLDTRRDLGDKFMLPSAGYLLAVKSVVGVFNSNKYGKVVRLDFIPNTNPPSEDAAWDMIDNAPCLDKLLRTPVYADMAAAVVGAEVIEKTDSATDGEDPFAFAGAQPATDAAAAAVKDEEVFQDPPAKPTATTKPTAPAKPVDSLDGQLHFQVVPTSDTNEEEDPWDDFK